jgi:DNA invertase Pin-like site-specific DNA recombinase
MGQDHDIARRLMLTVLRGLVEFERDLTSARTRKGRARAVARGDRARSRLLPPVRAECSG